MPLSPSATRELLEKLGHSPKRFLGQNFLVDGNIVRKSLELAGVTAGDRVVEVGPGLGTLTSALLQAGADVWAVEKDRTLHAHLAETLVPAFPTTFHLLEGDAVEHPRAGLPDGSDFKIVANLPYAIATPWLDEILSGPLPSQMVLMLQLEAAQRYSAPPGSKSFGAISVFLQAAYEVAPGHKVSAGCFHPRPDVESHLLHVIRRPAPVVLSRESKALVRECFQQRRKQIGALLRQRVPTRTEEAALMLQRHGCSEQTRPEAIPLACWLELARLAPRES